MRLECYAHGGPSSACCPVHNGLLATGEPLLSAACSRYGQIGGGIPRGQEGPPGTPGEVSQAALDGAIAGTARNPSGQMGNLDPNWNPSGDTNADLIWLRDRLVEHYNANAR